MRGASIAATCGRIIATCASRTGQKVSALRVRRAHSVPAVVAVMASAVAAAVSAADGGKGRAERA